MMLPWRSLLAATAAAAAAIAARLDCNPTVFFYDAMTSSSKKHAYYSDKRIWIIGASSGIGREFAYQLAGESAAAPCNATTTRTTFSPTARPPPRVVILSGRNVKQLETVAQQCRTIQKQSLSSITKTTTAKARTAFCVVPLDVTDHERMEYVVQHQVPALLQYPALDSVDGDKNEDTFDYRLRYPSSSSSSSLPSACSILDIIVLNSGAGHLSPALRTSPKVIKKVMQTNAIWPMIFMPLLLNSVKSDATSSEPSSSSSSSSSAAASSAMMKAASPSTTTTANRKTPHFIITSSIAADLRAVPLSAAYAASKAALTAYFCSLSAERPDLILDMILPGPVDTDFHCHHIENGNDDDVAENDGATTATTTTRLASAQKASPLSSLSSSQSSSPPLKMSVQRCAQLVLSAASMRGLQQSRIGGGPSSYRHIWIAAQPVLFILYLHQWMPSFLLNTVFARMGPKRIAMWEAGLDLYDPKSWMSMQQQQQDKIFAKKKTETK
jgi:NAD(P)-dependent dehydrogenase (short-subunit alcohol dehydrogenase family)